MTTGEGVAVGLGLLVVAAGAYAVVSTLKAEDAATQRMQQVVLPSQGVPTQAPKSGSKALDAGLAVLNGLGGINGVFQLVDRFAK